LFPCLLPAKRLFAQIRDLSMNIQILALEVVQLSCKLKNLRAQHAADLERHSTRVFVELSNFIATVVRILLDRELDKFGRATSKNSPKGDSCACSYRCRCQRRRGRPRRGPTRIPRLRCNENENGGEQDDHRRPLRRLNEMREGLEYVASGCETGS